jgi:dTDP-4-dehydrorhamnose reductase
MKILITGGDAQLGRALVVALQKHQVQSAGHDRLDIADPAAVLAAVQGFAPDLVINTAAYNDVDGSESNRAQAHAVNATGPRNLALATASMRIPLMHFSTDYVFDGALRRPYNESDTPHPLSAYGADKLAGEEAVRQLNERHYIVRTAWLFSAGGRNFLNTMRAMSGRPQVRIVCDQSSSPTYVPHLAAAAAELIETGAYGTFHMAGQGGTSKFELVRLCFSMLNLKTEVLPVPLSEFPSPARRPNYSVLTTTREPRIMLPRWQEGLSDFVRALEDGV